MQSVRSKQVATGGSHALVVVVALVLGLICARAALLAQPLAPAWPGPHPPNAAAAAVGASQDDPGSAYVIFSEEFESGLSGWEVLDADPAGPSSYWARVPAGFGGHVRPGAFAYCAGMGYGGSPADPRYQPSMHAVMRRTVSLSGYLYPRLFFTHKLASAEPGHDYGQLRINATILATFDQAGDWLEPQYDLGAYTGQDVTLEWLFHSDASNQFEGWYVDSIRIVGCVDARPQLLSPADGAVAPGSQLTLRWSGELYPDGRYELQVDDDPAFRTPLISAPVSDATSYVITPALAVGSVWYWRARLCEGGCGCRSWSEVRSLRICGGPAAPSLALPADERALPGAGVTLTWFPVAGASEYRMQVDDDAGFQSPLVDRTLTETTFTLVPVLPTGSAWYWRVQARNDCTWGAWSTAWRLTICALPAAPALISPSNGATLPYAQLRLDWEPVTEAIAYQVVVDDDLAFGSPDVDITTTMHTLDIMPPGAPAMCWAWRVRARNALCWGEWSPVWYFCLAQGPTPAPSGTPTPSRTPGPATIPPLPTSTSTTGATPAGTVTPVYTKDPLQTPTSVPLSPRRFLPLIRRP